MTTTVVGLRDAILAGLRTGLKDAVPTIQAHRGRLNASTVRELSMRAPAVLLSCLGATRGVDEGPYTVNDWEWVAWILTTDTIGTGEGQGVGSRDDAAMILAEAITDIVSRNRWGLDKGKAPMRIRTRNVDPSGALDEMGVALWSVSWTQPFERDLSEPANALETIWTYYDRVGEVGDDTATRAQDNIEPEQP